MPFHAADCPDWVPDGEQFPPREYVFTLEIRVLAEHEKQARANLNRLVGISHVIKSVEEREWDLSQETL